MLEFVGNGNAVTVVPDGHDDRGIEDAHGVDGFPKHAFGRACVADRAPSNFVAVVAEVGELLKISDLAVKHGSVGQAHQARHL